MRLIEPPLPHPRPVSLLTSKIVAEPSAPFSMMCLPNLERWEVLHAGANELFQRVDERFV